MLPGAIVTWLLNQDNTHSILKLNELISPGDKIFPRAASGTDQDVSERLTSQSGWKFCSSSRLSLKAHFVACCFHVAFTLFCLDPKGFTLITSKILRCRPGNTHPCLIIRIPVVTHVIHAQHKSSSLHATAIRTLTATSPRGKRTYKNG